MKVVIKEDVEPKLASLRQQAKEQVVQAIKVSTVKMYIADTVLAIMLIFFACSVFLKGDNSVTFKGYLICVGILLVINIFMFADGWFSGIKTLPKLRAFKRNGYDLSEYYSEEVGYELPEELDSIYSDYLQLYMPYNSLTFIKGCRFSSICSDTGIKNYFIVTAKDELGQQISVGVTSSDTVCFYSAEVEEVTIILDSNADIFIRIPVREGIKNE